MDASFREAIGTTELTLAIALGRSASAMSGILYVYYEPVAYLVVVLDPFEKKVSLSAKDTNWHVLYDQFNALIEKAETLLRQDRLFDAVGTCIREGCEWVEAMRKLGRP